MNREARKLADRVRSPVLLALAVWLCTAPLLLLLALPVLGVGPGLAATAGLLLAYLALCLLLHRWYARTLAVRSGFRNDAGS